MEKLVEHHIKYLEIHDVDETVWLTRGEHKKLHNRLRREGKCKIPVDELNKISQAAHDRTPERKAAQAKNAARRKKNTHTFRFTEQPSPNITLTEKLTYYYKTGNISYSASFHGTHAHKLPVVNLK